MAKESLCSVAFIGNPNCGKTTLFNSYTGAKLKAANWPGVTVEKKEGEAQYHGEKYKLVDLPGIYSLTSYTMEEKLSREYIMGDEVDVVVDVIDASSLEKSLYLALQLIELGKPVVMAFNMMDIVDDRGMEIDFHRLPEILGAPCIPISARKGTGLEVLMHAVKHHKGKPCDRLEHERHLVHNYGESHGRHKHNHHDEYAMVYSDEIEDKIDIITELLEIKYPDTPNCRWHALKYLEQDEEILKKYPLNLKGIADISYESDIINQKYDFIEEIIKEVLVGKDRKSMFTDKLDKVLTHRFWSIPIFLIIMAIVFAMTFVVGDFIKGYFEAGLGLCSEHFDKFLIEINTNGVLRSLIIDGIFSGVGGILAFLPNIFILFLALAFLEDSGYMSRVAYVMDGVMSKAGLSGRAFIPMLLGFGCTVPAVMASRTLENENDRLRTIFITPFMSCSARLPVYVLLSEMFFGNKAMIAAYSMYVIGILAAVAAALIIKAFSKNKHINDLLIELPEYKSPNLRSISIYVQEKVKDYLTKAGTTIFIASIILWVILNFGPDGMVGDNISQSFGASIGRALVPIMSTAGLGYWQIAVALISGIAAKEVVVSSMSVLYGITNVSSAAGMSSLASILSAQGFTAVNAYSMMIFCLLYVPCIAAIAAIKRETRSLKWTLCSIVMQLATAWTLSTVFYQLASLIK